MANMSFSNGSGVFNKTESCEIPLAWAVVMISANLLSTIVGVIGNCLVCIAVWKTASLHSTINYYMVSLAIADLIVTLVVQPLMIAVIMGRLYGDFECTNTLDKVYRALGNFSCAASFLNLCCISLERFLAVLRPLATFRSAKSKRFVYLLFICWLVAFFYSFLRVFSSRRVTSYFSGATFALGYIWMVSCYVTILILLAKQSKRQSTMRASGQDARQGQPSEKKITITMILVIACFTIMWLPLFYFRLSGNPSLNSGFVYELAITVALCNSAFNPVIYSFRSKKYCYAFKCTLINRGRSLSQQTTRVSSSSKDHPSPAKDVWKASSELRKSLSSPI